MRLATTDQDAVAGNSEALAEELRSLISGCGIYPMDKARLALTGSDRVRWLNGMVTNNVRDLAPGHGVYAFVLNPQGHIQADLYAFNSTEKLVVEVDRNQVDTVKQIFDRYIIMDDVEVTDIGGDFTVIGLAGARSANVLVAVGWDVGEMGPLEFATVQWNGSEATIVRGDYPGIPSYEVWIRQSDMEGVWKALLVTGAQPVHEPALEAFRIAGGIPRFGQDIRARDLPQETGQERALNFNKGCYIGQEIVERIRARGAIHRTLAGFEIAGSVPAPGSKVQQDGRDVGEITSIVRLPFEGGERLVGMGYLRKEFMASDKLKSGDASVRFAKLPFTELIETFQK